MDIETGKLEEGACAVQLDENDDSDGWDEMEIAGEQTTCLFCPKQFLTIAVAMDHCRTEHEFDLLELKTKFNMDCYSYIKMINYIRRNNPTPESILQSENPPWSSFEFLKPGEMESWLMYDFDDLGSAPSTPHYAIDGKAPITNITQSDLQRQVQELTFQLNQKELLLQNALDDITKMKRVTQDIISAGDTKIIQPNSVACIPVSCDNEYFNSYSHYGIHHEMLSDTVRTESYRSAIINNKDQFKNKTVLDVGCGTCILSMFCAQAGAKKVYGIDQSEIIYNAMEILRENNLNESICVIRGRLEDTELPENKFDIIISEWMGYFLLFEGMLDTVIYARNNHLNPDGLILPNKCNISITACSDIDKYNKTIGFWDNVYGFNMSCMKSEVISEAIIDIVSSDKIVSTASILTEIDLNTCTTEAPNFTSTFELKINEDAQVTALVGYFDTFFDLNTPVEFSTGPQSTPTHWKQTVFYLKNLNDYKKGDTLKGTLTCSRKLKNVRGLTIIITIGEDKYKYNLD